MFLQKENRKRNGPNKRKIHILIKKETNRNMRRAKRIVQYWCGDMSKPQWLGKGIVAAVLDTGIAPHPDFQNKILVFRDFVNGMVIPYDDNGHGTHVCGVLAGNGKVSDGMYSGMAPECDLIVLKVLDGKGNGDVAEVMKAFRWILENQKRYQIRIVNISVGMQSETDEREVKKMINGVEALWDAGLVVVAAAGNLGPQEGTVTTPGDSKKIITVGSADDQYPDGRGESVHRHYSGRGPTKECVCKPDLIAPGSYIRSCNAKFEKQKAKPYVMKSGTSMATPIVSGAIADLLCKYPDMSNVEVKLKLRESCINLGMDQNRQGWGLLNMKKLLE